MRSRVSHTSQRPQSIPWIVSKRANPLDSPSLPRLLPSLCLWQIFSHSHTYESISFIRRSALAGDGCSKKHITIRYLLIFFFFLSQCQLPILFWIHVLFLLWATIHDRNYVRLELLCKYIHWCIWTHHQRCSWNHCWIFQLHTPSSWWFDLFTESRPADSDFNQLPKTYKLQKY